MLDKNKRNLDQLLTKYESDTTVLRQKKEAERAALESFISEFFRLKKEIIWPAFVEIGNLLNKYGHNYHISEEAEFLDATAHFHPANITFNIYPAVLDKAFYQPDSTPYISFIADSYSKKVGIMVSTMMPEHGGTVGSFGQFDSGEITTEFVEKQVIALLTRSFF